MHKKTNNRVIYTVYFYNWYGCEFGASYEKCVQYACKYTEQIKMTDYIMDLHTAIFNSSTSCRKNHVLLDLIEKEHKNFDYIIIFCPALQWNKTYQTKGWIRDDGNVWLIEPMDNQLIEMLSILLAR